MSTKTPAEIRELERRHRQHVREVLARGDAVCIGGPVTELVPDGPTTARQARILHIPIHPKGQHTMNAPSPSTTSPEGMLAAVVSALGLDATADADSIRATLEVLLDAAENGPTPAAAGLSQLHALSPRERVLCESRRLDPAKYAAAKATLVSRIGRDVEARGRALGLTARQIATCVETGCSVEAFAENRSRFGRV